MSSLGTIFLFVFIFSILSVTRVVLRFIFSLLQTNPKPMMFGGRELIFYGCLISYIITYIIQN
jgi:hypothetical protein